MIMSTTFLPVSGSVHSGMNLGSPFFDDMLHHDDDLLDPGDEVHRPAHALDHLARHHPVGEVAVLADFHAAEHGKVDMAAADHREALRAVEIARRAEAG